MRLRGDREEHLVRSQLARKIVASREIVEAWKQAAIADGFTEVKDGA
jgi:hypothetical protein